MPPTKTHGLTVPKFRPVTVSRLPATCASRMTSCAFLPWPAMPTTMQVGARVRKGVERHHNLGVRVAVINVILRDSHAPHEDPWLDRTKVQAGHGEQVAGDLRLQDDELPRTFSSWNLAHTRPASTSSLDTVLIETSTMRDTERMDDPSQSIERICTRLDVDNLFMTRSI